MVKRVRRKSGHGNGGGGAYFAAPKSNLQFIHSGCKLLDLALGGGWACQRIANIVGDKSTGKTLLCIEASANFVRQFPKGKVRYREAEHAFDLEYARALGMPIERVDFGDPLETVEDLFEDMQKVVSKAKSEELYILDSLDALSDRGEMERSMDQGTYGAQKAKNLSQLFRRLVGALDRSKVTVIIVSQVRDKIGVSFGRKTTRSGGRALDFYASQVLYVSHLGQLKRRVKGLERAYGVQLRGKLDKNKIGLPFREADFNIQFGFGIDDLSACVNWLKTIKALKDIDVREAKVSEYLDEISEMPFGDYQKELKFVHKVVENRWYEIEREFLPARSKYNQLSAGV